MKRIILLLTVLLVAGNASARKPKRYDHGNDEASFQLVAHVKATREEASRCISDVRIGNSDVEIYNYERPTSCLGFSNLSAGMDFKARFALICKGHFDNCDKKSVENARTGILVYLPPTVPGNEAIIQEYVIIGTREVSKGP